MAAAGAALLIVCVPGLALCAVAWLVERLDGDSWRWLG